MLVVIALTLIGLTGGSARAYSIGAFPLAQVTSQAVHFASQAAPVAPTGLSASDYLDTISGIVVHFQAQQNAEGAIIDKYAKEEIQYSTPCYSFAAATLVERNHTQQRAVLLESAIRAFNFSLTALVDVTCAQGHCNFYIMPLMFAYRILSQYVSVSQKAQWETMLRAINPDKAYINLGNNWGLVAVAGEYLRDKAGLNTEPDWYKKELEKQWESQALTDNGNYEDHSGMDGLNPMPYDAFPRKYIAVMLREGYAGAHAADLTELMRRGKLVSLIMQSPRGEIPTGGRSSQHQWNEAVMTVLYELGATDTDQSADSHCQYKRASRLSLQSVRRWQNEPTGELQIIKNHFDPSLRWGYESYSYQAQYNLLPASMLATALLYMDDTIAECAAPAEVGGFAFRIPKLNKIFANAAGLYVELETAADPHYDSSGLQRVHQGPLQSLLGPSAGTEQQHGGLAIGAFWTTADGTLSSLANSSYKDIKNIDFAPNGTPQPDSVAFTVHYQLDRVRVTEEYTLSPSTGVQVRASLSGDHITAFGVRFPAFLFDGHSYTSVLLTNTTAQVSLPGNPQWGTQTFQVDDISPGHHVLCALDGEPVVSRNGLLQSVACPIAPILTSSPSISYTIRPRK